MPAIRSSLYALTASPLVRGLVAFGSAEAATRVIRLGVLLIVARRVTPEMFGTAALALSLFELVRVLANAGIGQRLILASDAELPALCRTAYRLFWIVCLGVAGVQLSVAAIAAWLFDLPQAGAMLTVLAIVYCVMPPGLVQIFLTMRAMRMESVARIAATQNIADSLLTLSLVLVWPSAWAIVLPKLLAAPVWTLLARRSTPWHADRSIRPAPWREFALFGPAILASEMLAAARLNADKLVVGALFGTEVLGLYYFAFNAGLGITQSFVAACNLVIFPHLAKAGHASGQREFRKAFAAGFAMLAPVVAAQALLSPFYVPLVFGETWIPAVPYIALLSLAALPLYAGSLVGAALRVERRPHQETLLTACASAAALAGLAAGSPFGLTGACIGYGTGLALAFIPAAALRLAAPTRNTLSIQGAMS
ncbi:oligosaccharide flippase family protein [Erythrobacter sp.]|uniref:oligosaccharide flippase family protein n=1 Tax=Erythrobacter sp. TaxID=1042 RepID=UPI001B0227C6|nr:oligosaccharide flippase family protein [Erythrobacter sp.]MBO6527393.1 oligosaccharide flippase family protein [Erythrobacter sp.]MBO6530777.1 oligosaccharide flippase family protein [Erythrobacter sp.]